MSATWTWAPGAFDPTPGPWRANQLLSGGFLNVRRGQTLIARVPARPGSYTTFADARLIAAAPELLAFARWCVSAKFDSRSLNSYARETILKATWSAS